MASCVIQAEQVPSEVGSESVLIGLAQALFCEPDSLFAMMSAYSLYCDACAVRFDVFEKVSENHPLKFLASNPYALAARCCVGKTTNALFGVSSDVAYVFEDGAEGKGELMRIMERDGYSAPIFKPSRDRVKSGRKISGLIPLQASDFAAYEVRKQIADNPGDLHPLEKYRKSLVALARIARAGSDDWGTFREQELIALCNESRKRGLILE